MMKLIEMESQVNSSAIDVLQEYLRIGWRRKWLIVGCLLLSLTAAWVYCMLAPKLYRSETLILVEEQKIPENYVQGVVEGNLEQRIFVIQKQIVSRPFLKEIVKEFNLYPEEVAKSGEDAATGILAGATLSAVTTWTLSLSPFFTKIPAPPCR
jgi:uncharacterized protein involved in exopolysaccharide biosynthesis